MDGVVAECRCPPRPGDLDLIGRQEQGLPNAAEITKKVATNPCFTRMLKA